MKNINKSTQIEIASFLAAMTFLFLSLRGGTTKQSYGRWMLYTIIMLPLLFSIETNAQQKIIHETFLDAQNKNKYPEEVITALSGDWMFNDALVTNIKSNDIRSKAPRLLGPVSVGKSNGFISTEFDIKGLKAIKVGFIGYKDDISDYYAVEVFVSKDSGRNWASLGVRRGDPSKEEEAFAEYKINNKKKESYRVKIANASAPKGNRLSRINITEIQFDYEE